MSVTQNEAQSPETEILDLEGLFRYSGMVDALRDAAKVLLRHEVSRPTLKQMAQQYADLRGQLVKVLAADAAAETPQWAHDLDPDTVTIDGVYFACMNLSRWMDLLHQTPAFLLSQQVQAVNQREAATKVQAAMAAMPSVPAGAPEVPTLSTTSGTGQYL